MKKVLILALSLFVFLSLTACGSNPSTENFTEIVWPSSDLVSKLPVPESTYGKINSESADYFSVDIGNVTNEQFNSYITACQDAGYTVDYSKSSTSFSAYNEDGYYVWVSYSSEDDVMDIMTSAPEAEDDSSEEEGTTNKTEKKTTTEKTTTTTESKNDDNIDPDFKEAMDAYEAFMDDYVEFMKKYQDNPTDLSLLADYAKFMSDYSDYSEAFAEWEDEDLNDAELEYYMEVLNRVNKKLLEVA